MHLMRSETCGDNSAPADIPGPSAKDAKNPGLSDREILERMNDGTGGNEW